MKRLALAAAALFGLSACTHSSAPGASHDNGTSSAGQAIAPISCSQQYRTWTKGEGRGVMGALNSVTSAATARDDQALTAALRHAKPAVVKGPRPPIPACADPRGYWDPLLMHVNAAAYNKGSKSGARAAMHDVPELMHKLAADVRKTAGQ